MINKILDIIFLIPFILCIGLVFTMYLITFFIMVLCNIPIFIYEKLFDKKKVLEIL